VQVLVLEPDRDVLELLELVLGVAGFTVVADADEADALIVDPAYSELFNRAVALKQSRPGLRVVCVSIAPAEPHVIQALAPSAYLQKPFARAELVAALSGIAQELRRSS
jgi:DNA-binding response OmpR family regulator